MCRSSAAAVSRQSSEPTMQTQCKVVLLDLLIMCVLLVKVICDVGCQHTVQSINEYRQM